ncbi:MAG: type II toxin-antitoxin system VapC family toxin [Burkholderiaceae bacterium]
MVVLDTNTISYYFRGDPQVVPRLQGLPPSEIAVPAIVVYELRYGLSRLPAEAAQLRLFALQTLLRPLRILDFDAACAEQAASVRSALERQGTPIGPYDLLIAATALRHQARLVTRNEREFARVPGLQVINWHAA